MKIGAHAIGRDINPVACFSTRTALSLPSRERVLNAFHEIESRAANRILHYYEARLPSGKRAETLYYFWVKVLPCPQCGTSVDLFSSYIFARHAYPKLHPDAQSVCPHCGDISVTRFDSEKVICHSCHATYNPQAGPVRGQYADCSTCGHSFRIAEVVKRLGAPPPHRLYAKLVMAAGEKIYLPADDFDCRLYQEAELALGKHPAFYPLAAIPPGHNTDQAIRYGYTHWFQMFNSRQLLAAGLLANAIQELKDPQARDLFLCLLSGTLEFNNMFASYKGEGTGAVRHLFSHHILKPERTPLEANFWGTPKSSGAFSTLFRRRILKAMEYCEDPFELRPRTGESSHKVFGLSIPLSTQEAGWTEKISADISCGSSSHTELRDESVDAVITDPPFFDNVHYSELADFFYVWQCHWLGRNDGPSATTRSNAEVQHTQASEFVSRLEKVWTECHRVLKANGLLVFTYHHSRSEGWLALLESLARASFTIVQVHPVKSEMESAAPKSRAREPINYDMVVVCRKTKNRESASPQLRAIFDEAAEAARRQVGRLRAVDRRLGSGDVRALFKAQVVRALSRWEFSVRVVEVFEEASRLGETEIQLLQTADIDSAVPPELTRSSSRS